MTYRESAEMPDYSDPPTRNWRPAKRFAAKTILTIAIECGALLFTLLIAWGGGGSTRLGFIMWLALHSAVLAASAIIVPIRWAIRTLDEPVAVKESTDT